MDLSSELFSRSTGATFCSLFTGPRAPGSVEEGLPYPRGDGAARQAQRVEQDYDTKALRGTTPDQAQVLTTNLQASAYRMQKLLEVRAGGRLTRRNEA